MTVVETTGPFSGFHGSLGFGRSPDWQVRQPDPVPPASGVGFPRSKGATPVSVALVLNYNKCEGGDPNKQHGPPLAYPSCTPVRTGNPVTVGTPDSNGKAAEASGSVRLDTMVGDPATPADEADVHIHVQQTDVWNAFPVNAMTDYAGNLVIFAPLRTTDLLERWRRLGRVSHGGRLPLRVAVPCVVTAGPRRRDLLDRHDGRRGHPGIRARTQADARAARSGAGALRRRGRQPLHARGQQTAVRPGRISFHSQ